MLLVWDSLRFLIHSSPNPFSQHASCVGLKGARLAGGRSAGRHWNDRGWGRNMTWQHGKSDEERGNNPTHCSTRIIGSLWLPLFYEVSHIKSLRLQPQPSTVAAPQPDRLFKQEETSGEIESFSFISSFSKWKMPEGELPSSSTVSQPSLSLFQWSLYITLRFAVPSYSPQVVPHPCDTTYSDTVISGKHRVSTVGVHWGTAGCLFKLTVQLLAENSPVFSASSQGQTP